jgi:hypothetical protein
MKKTDRNSSRKVSVANTPKQKSSSTSRGSSRSEDFNPDYSYVIKDLKRIGILAGSFITILVVLAFFLN